MKLQSHRGAASPPPENSTAYEEYLAEGAGEAAYVATMLIIYAVSIAFMIGYMSFKKNKYRQWDREANQYLSSYYKRHIKHEKTRLQTFADKFNPGMTVLFATGLAMGSLGRSRTQASSAATSDRAAQGDAAADAVTTAAESTAEMQTASAAPGRRLGRERLALSEIIEEEESDLGSGLSRFREDSRSRLIADVDVVGEPFPPETRSKLLSRRYEIV